MKLLSIQLLVWALSFASVAQAEKILIVGDSLTCGSFGSAMFDDLRQKGHDVTLYCAVSSAPANWLEGRTPKGQKCEVRSGNDRTNRTCPPSGQTPALAKILADVQPDRVISALGTNSIPDKKASDSYSKMSRMIAENGRRCIWVGPPQFKRKDLQNSLNSFYDSLILRTEQSCDFVDSRDATAPGTPGAGTVSDGVHRTNEGGKAWYGGVRGSIASLIQSKAAGKGTKEGGK